MDLELLDGIHERQGSLAFTHQDRDEVDFLYLCGVEKFVSSAWIREHNWGLYFEQQSASTGKLAKVLIYLSLLISAICIDL